MGRENLEASLRVSKKATLGKSPNPPTDSGSNITCCLCRQVQVQLGDVPANVPEYLDWHQDLAGDLS